MPNVLQVASSPSSKTAYISRVLRTDFFGSIARAVRSKEMGSPDVYLNPVEPAAAAPQKRLNQMKESTKKALPPGHVCFCTMSTIEKESENRYYSVDVWGALPEPSCGGEPPNR